TSLDGWRTNRENATQNCFSVPRKPNLVSIVIFDGLAKKSYIFRIHILATPFHQSKARFCATKTSGESHALNRRLNKWATVVRLIYRPVHLLSVQFGNDFFELRGNVRFDG